MIVVDLRHVGTTAWLSEVLKISVGTSVSCAAQSFSTRPGMLSGPAALHGLILDRVFLTSAGDRQSAWSLGGVGSFCAGVSFCKPWIKVVECIREGWIIITGLWRGLVFSDGLNGLPQTICVSLLSVKWFFEHMTILHFWCHRTDWLLLFWGLLYLLIWMLHLWSLAAHKHLLSSTAFGLHMWWWSWWL